jgi:hypothetical protein
VETLLQAGPGAAGLDGAAVDKELLARRLADLPPEARAALRRRRRGAASSAIDLRRRAPGARVPLAFGQERLWVLEQFTPGNPAYNETNSLP